MGQHTKIQWAHHTFNPWRGCSRVAAGCANCYAADQAKRNPSMLGTWGAYGTRVVAAEKMWRQPVKWDREAAQLREAWAEDCAERDSLTFPGKPERPRVFCGSMCDVFEDWESVVRNGRGEPLHDAAKWMRGATGTGGAEWLGVANQFIGRSLISLDNVRARLFALIDATPNLAWLLLTKRPENIRRMWPRTSDLMPHRANTLLGTSIACQEDVDRNLAHLVECKRAGLCRLVFASVEPLLEPVRLQHAFDGRLTRNWLGEGGIDWVIVGGESGPHARPCDVAWIRSIVEQCREAGVPCFVKQLGAKPECRCDESGWPRNKVASCNDNSCRRIKLQDPKGGDPAEWPKELRVREIPQPVRG